MPVLRAEVIAALTLRPGGTYIDCTLGGGGHAEAILERTAPDGRLLGLERDPHAIAQTYQRLQAYSERLVMVNRSFAEVGEVARAHEFTQVDGILFDLGLSSLQLADAARGFSFGAQGALDMRFDPAQELSAADVVNEWSERELADLIYQYGEEPHSRAIARAIVRRRPLYTTNELTDVIASAARRRGKLHPATRTFQALRIVVNDELGTIERALPQALALLRPEGRIAIISFHSLEDRIVKHFLRAQQQCGALAILTKKPITASADEQHANPPSRSAKLRFAARVKGVEFDL